LPSINSQLEGPNAFEECKEVRDKAKYIRGKHDDEASEIDEDDSVSYSKLLKGLNNK
jgi:hypothetical protein